MTGREQEKKHQIITRYKDIERQRVESKILTAKYNTNYKNIKHAGLPLYLRKYKLGKNIAIIARIKWGNLDRSNK